MKTYRERLIAAMQLAGFVKPNGDPDQSALARRINEMGGKVTPQAIQYLCDPKRNAIGSRHTAAIAAACGVSAVWLATEEGEMLVPKVDKNIRTSVPEHSRQPIPLINSIPAGGPKEIVDAYHAGAGMDEIVPDVDVGPFAFGLIIDGDSMEPTFHTGDKVIIDPSIQPRPGDFVAFKCKNGRTHEEDGTFKQYRPRGHNAQGLEYYELVPLNQNYPTIRSDQLECTICGVMVEHRIYRKPR